MQTPENFRLRFPEFTSQSDEVIGLLQADASLEMGESEDGWLGCYSYCHDYLTAHYLTLRNTQIKGDASSQSGIPTNVSVGGQSVAYASTSGNNTYLNSTSYGQVYTVRRNLLFAGGGVVYV